MKMSPLLALIFWGSKLMVLGVHTQPDLGCLARFLLPSASGLIFSSFMEVETQLRTVLK